MGGIEGGDSGKDEKGGAGIWGGPGGEFEFSTPIASCLPSCTDVGGAGGGNGGDSGGAGDAGGAGGDDGGGG